MAVRGRKLGAYSTDGGAGVFNTMVDADRFAVAAFNWVAGIPGNAFLPRRFKPRHVTGLSVTSGRRASATVPSLGADIWTGAATTFDVEADDQTIDTMTVVSRIGEKPSLP